MRAAASRIASIGIIEARRTAAHGGPARGRCADRKLSPDDGQGRAHDRVARTCCGQSLVRVADCNVTKADAPSGFLVTRTDGIKRSRPSVEKPFHEAPSLDFGPT